MTLAVQASLAAAPARWGRLRLKAAVSRLDKRNTDLSAPMMSLRTDGTIVPRSSLGERQEPAEASLPRYLVVYPGDLVINPMWLIGGAVGVSMVHGAVSPDYRVFRSSGHHSERYLHYLMRSKPYLDQYRLFTRANTTFDRRVQQGDLDNLPLAVPPLDEQRAIANYIDRETAQIDVLIGKQERLTGMLRERRAAMIERTVAQSAEAGWPVDKLGRRTRIGNGSTPRRAQVEFWEAGEFPWLNSAVVNRDVVESADQFVTPTALRSCHLPIVQPNSLLIGLTGQGKTRGMTTLLAIEATVSQHVAYVTPEWVWHPPYLLWALRSAYGQLRMLSDENGSTKGGLTCEDLKGLRLVRPPLEEQRRIADSLEERTAKIDTLISRAERFITVAKERRSALITAAVTGQIDLREHAPTTMETEPA